MKFGSEFKRNQKEGFNVYLESDVLNKVREFSKELKIPVSKAFEIILREWLEMDVPDYLYQQKKVRAWEK